MPISLSAGMLVYYSGVDVLVHCPSPQGSSLRASTAKVTLIDEGNLQRKFILIGKPTETEGHRVAMDVICNVGYE